MKVPAFLLRRLYAKGSLKNTTDGFQFQLRNQLGSGYARKLMPLVVDGTPIPLESSWFAVDGREVSFSAVTESNPFTLALNKTTTIAVRHPPLEKAPHKIEMAFEVPGLGTLSFDFTDIPSDG